jgi:hypothetical protein
MVQAEKDTDEIAWIIQAFLDQQAPEPPDQAPEAGDRKKGAAERAGSATPLTGAG